MKIFGYTITINLFWEFIKLPAMLTALRILLIAVVGYFVLKFAMRFVRKALSGQTKHLQILVGRAVYYAGIAFIIISILHELNFQISALLGAAGIAGAAIGFASQTSVSNIISGVFLLTESPFKIGDYIVVAGVEGTVVSIDLLSVKLRQADGTFVRVPNTQVISSSVVNNSYFDERRFNFNILVSQKQDLRRVIDLLQQAITANQFTHKEKAPLLLCDQYNESTLKIKVGVWATQKNWSAMKNSILVDIKQLFDKEQIIIPFTTYVAVDKQEKY